MACSVIALISRRFVCRIPRTTSAANATASCHTRRSLTPRPMVALWRHRRWRRHQNTSSWLPRTRCAGNGADGQLVPFFALNLSDRAACDIFHKRWMQPSVPDITPSDMATETTLRPGEIKDILLREIEAADLHELDV